MRILNVGPKSYFLSRPAGDEILIAGGGTLATVKDGKLIEAPIAKPESK